MRFHCYYASDPIRTKFASAIEEMFSTAGRGTRFFCIFPDMAKRSMAFTFARRRLKTVLRILTTIGISTIKRFIVPAKRLITILVLDCCYSGLAMGTFKGGDVDTTVWEQLGRPSCTYLMTSSSMT